MNFEQGTSLLGSQREVKPSFQGPFQIQYFVLLWGLILFLLVFKRTNLSNIAISKVSFLRAPVRRHKYICNNNLVIIVISQVRVLLLCNWKLIELLIYTFNLNIFLPYPTYTLFLKDYIDEYQAARKQQEGGVEEEASAHRFPKRKYILSKLNIFHC